eukprot:1536932-Rhodomonas_salina.1
MTFEVQLYRISQLHARAISVPRYRISPLSPYAISVPHRRARYYDTTLRYLSTGHRIWSVGGKPPDLIERELSNLIPGATVREQLVAAYPRSVPHIP